MISSGYFHQFYHWNPLISSKLFSVPAVTNLTVLVLKWTSIYYICTEFLEGMEKIASLGDEEREEEKDCNGIRVGHKKLSHNKNS